MHPDKPVNKENSEWGKILYKSLTDSISQFQNQIWQISYYCLLIYVAIFALINSFYNNYNDTIIFILYLSVFLTGTLSFRIILQKWFDIKNYRKYIYQLSSDNIYLKNSYIKYEYRPFFDVDIYFAFSYAILIGFGLVTYSLVHYFTIKIYWLITILLIYIAIIILDRMAGKKDKLFDIILEIIIGVIYISIFLLIIFDELVKSRKRLYFWNSPSIKSMSYKPVFCKFLLFTEPSYLGYKYNFLKPGVKI